MIGEPTPVMQALGLGLEALAGAFKLREAVDPLNRHPKEEPFKRYVYDRNGHGSGNGNGAVPYRTEKPTRPDLWTRLTMKQADLTYAALATGMKGLRVARWRHGDAEIDDYLMWLIESGVGFGF